MQILPALEGKHPRCRAYRDGGWKDGYFLGSHPSQSTYINSYLAIFAQGDDGSVNVVPLAHINFKEQP